LLAALTEQGRYTVAGLSALTNPMLNTLNIDLQANFGTTRNGVEETNTLNVRTAVTGVAAVGHYQMVKRTLFGAGAS
jgi:hypothetical protein